MEDDKIYLKKLKNEIESLYVDDTKRLDLIKDYNQELYEELPFLDEPLPEECELDDNLISVGEYKDFRDDFKKNGYYTFKRFIDSIDIIAEVRIKKVKKKVLVYADVMKLYKGQIESSFIMRTQETWLPDKWFKEKEICLVFLNYKSSKEYFAFGIGNKMSIIAEGNEKYVSCYDYTLGYFGDAEIISLSEGIAKVRYEDVIKQIL